jgi:hypothetical protein
MIGGHESIVREVGTDQFGNKYLIFIFCLLFTTNFIKLYIRIRFYFINNLYKISN